MGKMNLLKANWEGKVGETVGAKWKNKKTIRTYTKPSNPNTQAQKTVRSAFKDITSFVALFADQIKYLTALDTTGMSVRNAIIKLNKSLIELGNVNTSSLMISKGGLQKPTGVAALKDPSSKKVTVSWYTPTATNFTDEAKAIVVIVKANEGLAEVVTTTVKSGEATGNIEFETEGAINTFVYFLDKRGNAKVASNSVYALA